MSDEASELWAHVDAVENRFEPELAWPPPPVEPVEPSIEYEVGGFFGTKRRAMRRSLVGLLGTVLLCGATAAVASESSFDIVAEPRVFQWAPKGAPAATAAQASGVTATTRATSSGAVAWPLATSARSASVESSNQRK